MPKHKTKSRMSVLITPQRVLKKIQEAGFFLKKMEQLNAQADEIGFYLSAFLSALKSVEYLAPLANKNRRTQIRDEIYQLRHNHPSLNYLLETRDAEVHREGVEIVLELGAARKLTKPSFIFPSARFKSRFEGRFQGRFTPSRLGASQTSSIYQPVYRDAWYFRDYSHEVVQTCRDSLDALADRVAKSLGMEQEVRIAAKG
jgi:hypothetical protein